LSFAYAVIRAVYSADTARHNGAAIEVNIQPGVDCKPNTLTGMWAEKRFALCAAEL
jgi:hypothetical protein